MNHGKSTGTIVYSTPRTIETPKCTYLYAINELKYVPQVKLILNRTLDLKKSEINVENKSTTSGTKEVVLKVPNVLKTIRNAPIQRCDWIS